MYVIGARALWQPHTNTNKHSLTHTVAPLHCRGFDDPLTPTHTHAPLTSTQTHTDKDGRRYEGEYKADKMHGRGEEEKRA